MRERERVMEPSVLVDSSSCMLVCVCVSERGCVRVSDWVSGSVGGCE